MKKSNRRTKLPLKYKDHVMEDQNHKRDGKRGERDSDSANELINRVNDPDRDSDSVNELNSKVNDPESMRISASGDGKEGDSDGLSSFDHDNNNSMNNPYAESFWSNSHIKGANKDGFHSKDYTLFEKNGDTNSSPFTFNPMTNNSSGMSHSADISQEDLVFSKNMDEPIVKAAPVSNSSYVGILNTSTSSKDKIEAANFKFVKVDNNLGDDISIPRQVVQNVSRRFENTLYGYFIGKRLAFPVVEYFVKNNWAKYGLNRIMMNAKVFFFFKFDSRVGLESVLEGGPWMIKNNPIILKKWAMNTSLLKEELHRVPIWVKFHDVPLEIFDEEGISIVGSHIGKPIMLDAYTSSMCKDSWGRSSFARCLIEVNSDEPLKESFTVGIPVIEGEGYSKELIKVEYEWKPPRCDKCKVFGHGLESCPNNVVADKPTSTNLNVSDDGFQQVVNRKRPNKGSKVPRGVPMSQGFKVGKDFTYQPKKPIIDHDNGSKRVVGNNTDSSSKGNDGDSIRDRDVVDTGKMHMSNISTPNPFVFLEDDDDEEVENVYDESVNLELHKSGASTPVETVSNV